MKYIYNFYALIFIGNILFATEDSIMFHRYFWANYNQFKGDLPSAHHWYKSLFASHCSLYTYKGYLNFLFDNHQYNKIVELIPSLDKKFEKDSEVQLFFAIALEKEKKINEADNRFIKLNNIFKSNADITLRTTQVYIRRKEPENALITIDTFLNNSPRKSNNFIFYYLKSQIHLQLNQLPQALHNITLCLDLHPKFDKGWLLFAALQEQKGEIKKAMQGYNSFLELSGDNTIEKHLFSLMLQHKTNDQYKQFHKSYFDRAISLYNKKEYKNALLCLNKYLLLQDDNYEALTLKIQLLAQLHNYKEIKKLISSLVKQNPTSGQLWAKSVYLLQYNNIEKSHIITILKSLAEKENNNYWFFLYAADLCIKSQQISDAIILLNQTLRYSSDTILNAKINHQLSLLYYDMQDYQQMLTHLEKGLILNEKCAHLNNTLAYYWATKGKDIQKALSFFDKIDAQHKTNPCFLDTQALIFYKQEQYNKAQEILEQIQEHNNATILLHLAKTYYKLNNKEKALIISQKAASCIMNNHEEKKLHNLQLLLNN